MSSSSPGTSAPTARWPPTSRPVCVTTDLAASTTDFTNSIVFSAGCHSGYNIVDSDAIPGVTLPLDWAQAFARKKATLIAGTGYQYGDTDFIEYSDQIYLNFARELRAGTGAVAVGAALVAAKLDYLATTPNIRGIPEKSLLETTLFGLPMLGVNMPSGRGAGPGNGGTITPVAVASGPAQSLGLETYDLSAAPALTAHAQSLTNLGGGPNVNATWLSGPDGVVSNPGEPVLPLAALNVTPKDPTLVLRGIGFRGGSYVDSAPLFPFSGAPTTELRGVHVPFISPVFYPGRMWSPNYFGALAGSGGTELLVTPTQHIVASAADGTSTRRMYTGLSFRLYYSGNLSQAALSDAPSIVSVDAEPNAGGVLFTAASHRRSCGGDLSGVGHLHRRWRECVDIARLEPMRCAVTDGVQRRRLASVGWAARSHADQSQICRAGGERRRPGRAR